MIIKKINIEWLEINCSLGDPLPSQAFLLNLNGRVGHIISLKLAKKGLDVSGPHRQFVDTVERENHRF